VLFILFLAVLVPITGYTADLNADLIRAVVAGKSATVDTLLTKDANSNAKDNYGRTALSIAASNGYTKIVKSLLANGAEVNAKDRFGQTALSLAANNGNAEVVKLLLTNGADANIKDRDVHDRTALILAANNGHAEVVKALLAKGADVNAKDEFGFTASACAEKGGHMQIVSLLKYAGAKAQLTID
jgi:ankyrin repeat protein